MLSSDNVIYFRSSVLVISAFHINSGSSYLRKIDTDRVKTSALSRQYSKFVFSSEPKTTKLFQQTKCMTNAIFGWNATLHSRVGRLFGCSASLFYYVVSRSSQRWRQSCTQSILNTEASRFLVLFLIRIFRLRFYQDRQSTSRL